MVNRMMTVCHTAKGLYKAKGPYRDRVKRLFAFWEEVVSKCANDEAVAGLVVRVNYKRE